jgi:16S rRNA (cytosine1402-N4)-methyltransferase
MYAEVIAALTASACPRLIDGTLGAGGHAQGLLEKTGPDSQLLGLDADPAALQVARARLERFGNRVRLVHANFQRLAEIARQNDFVPADAILLDLGISSIQLADAERGGYAL